MIEIKNLNKSYNKKKILEDISFNLPKGKILGILGSNGAGKTTLLNAIAGDISYDGEIKIDGDYNFEFLKKEKTNLLLLSDEPFVYEFLTGIEFVKFVLDIQKIPFTSVESKVNLLFKLFNLEEDKDYLVKDYSHGMKRKISMIPSLVQAPKYLLLDEVASGLDTTSIIALKRYLVSLAKLGTTIILTTHIIDLIENLCDSVIILHNRKITMLDSIADKNKSDLERLYIDSIGSNIDNVIEEVFE